VASRVAGLTQAITDQVTGLLVPERDVHTLAERLEELLRHPDVGRRLGRAAREDVIRRFGWERAAEQFEQAYDRATEARRR
jgi:glycosyltransferase involved in cell wall biosynthesis